MLCVPAHMACSRPGMVEAPHHPPSPREQPLPPLQHPRRPLTQDLGPQVARGWACRGRSAGKEPPWFKKKNPRPPRPSSQQPASRENLSPCLAQSIESRSDLKKKKETGVVSFSGPCLCVRVVKNKTVLGWAVPARHEAGGRACAGGAARGNKDKGRACRQPRGPPRLNFVTSHMPGAHSRAGDGPLGLCQIATPHKVARGGVHPGVLRPVPVPRVWPARPWGSRGCPVWGDVLILGDAQWPQHNATHSHPSGTVTGHPWTQRKSLPHFAGEPQRPPTPGT